jgi:DNA-binding PadR family transcriptional regulator
MPRWRQGNDPAKNLVAVSPWVLYIKTVDIKIADTLGLNSSLRYEPGPTVTEQDFDVQGFARDINELLVLSTLREEAKHGYQIGLDVETSSNGLFRFRHGTLYPILHRLEESGMIRGSWSKDGGRRKKVYSLTPLGLRHLGGETNRVQEIVSRLLDVLRGPTEAET